MLEWQIGSIVPSIKGREVTLCEVRASMTQAGLQLAIDIPYGRRLGEENLGRIWRQILSSG